MKNKIILLDLNFTLVSNQQQTKYLRPFAKRMAAEEYRTDLLAAIKENKVIIITARPAYQGEATLENLRHKVSWTPQEAFFNDLNLTPPEIKESILKRFVFPKYGSNGQDYFAVESNPRTRTMYRKYGIQAEPYDVFIKRFPELATKKEKEENLLPLIFQEE